ncbi:MAG: hypothetical protein LBM09_02855, partial [Candidatus Nomurabacteria bacterium]|nr:hypothetical protein [Candidatus Nomurabacteria bacterium]
MKALYFPICGFFIALLLVVVYFSKPRVKNSETQVYSWMLIASLLDTILSIALLSITYINFDGNVSLIKVLNKVDFLQYILWANLIFFYVIDVSLKNRSLFEKIRRPLYITCIILDLLVYAAVLYLPLNIYNQDGTMYAYGPSVNLLYGFCAVYLLCLMFAVIYNVRNLLNKKYLPLLALLVFGSIIFIVRGTNPGLLIIPAALAYINLIMYFTISNPDIQIAKQQEQIVVQTKKINRDLRHMDRTKDEFLSLASHQLRTPLTSMRGYSAMLLDGDFGNLTPDQT